MTHEGLLRPAVNNLLERFNSGAVYAKLHPAGQERSRLLQSHLEARRFYVNVLTVESG